MAVSSCGKANCDYCMPEVSESLAWGDPLSLGVCAKHEVGIGLYCIPCRVWSFLSACAKVQTSTPEEFRLYLGEYYTVRNAVSSVLTYYAAQQPELSFLVLSHLLDGWDREEAVLSDDYYCETCGHYVSRGETEHWDMICGDCSQHMDLCDKCDTCDNHVEECCCCSGCEMSEWNCECCSYCSSYPCECDECERCGETLDNCGCGPEYGSSDYVRSDASRKPGWVKNSDDTSRYAPFPGRVPTADKVDRTIDPVRAAADFYLLGAVCDLVRFNDGSGDERAIRALSDRKAEATRSDSMLSAAQLAAKRAYSSLVDRLDATFLAYATSAVGGELRYHPACRNYAGMPRSNRSDAWAVFVKIVQEKGVSVLLDAVDLFNEFNGGAYGGKKWGDAAGIVAKRLSGDMPSWLFVDRMFTLEHNGGCFLNKVEWNTSNTLGYGLYHMKRVLNAHAGRCMDDMDGTCDCDTCTQGITNWALLLKVASPEVAALFRTADARIRRIAARSGVTVEPVPYVQFRHGSRLSRYSESD